MIGVKRRGGRVIHGEGLQRIWTPAKIPGLVDWFDAGVGISLNSGNVSQWAPRNGSDSTHILSQATVSLQPAYVASDSNFGGKPSIYLASSNYLRSSVWPSALAQPITYYLAATAKPPPSSTYEILVDGLDSSHRCVFYQYASKTKLFSGGAEAGPTATIPNACVYAAEFNGATSKLFRNASNVDILGGENPGTQSLTGLNIGTNGPNPTVYTATCYLAELLVYSGVHDQWTRRLIMRYLGLKYGIATS